MKSDVILNTYPFEDISIVKAENTTMTTTEGNEVVDFVAGIWTTALGHCNSRINKAIYGQIQKVTNLHTRFISPETEKLAHKLLNLISFKDGKIVLLSSGTEAVDFGMSLIKYTYDRPKFLTFNCSYFGSYGDAKVPRNTDKWVEIDFLKCSDCTHQESCDSNICNQLNSIDFSTIGAFIFEPGNSGGQVLLPPKKLVKYIESEIRKHGGVILVNEVTTGFGRTGKWFGYDHYDIDPDIIAFGKSIGNGYPVSAVATKGHIAQNAEDKGFLYAQSHLNDPLGAVVANEVISIIEEEDLINKACYKGEVFISELRKLQSNYDLICDVRGRGLMIVVEFSTTGIAEIVQKLLLERGYFVGVTASYNLLRFYPALTIPLDDIYGLCSQLNEILLSIQK